MKKLALIIGLLSGSLFANAQTFSGYDSLVNQLKVKDYPKYIGQEFYLTSSTPEQRTKGYAGFVIDYQKPLGKPANIYQPVASGSFYSSFDKMHENYFSVLDVILVPKERDMKDTCFFKLKDQTTGEILYYNTKWGFPFLTVGFYKAEKKRLLGKKCGFVEEDFEFFKAHEIQVPPYEPFQAWEVVGLAVEPNYGDLMVSLKNTGKEQYLNFEAVGLKATCDLNVMEFDSMIQALKVARKPEYSEKKIFSYAQVQPEFPGGEPTLSKYLRESIQYPVEEKKKGIEGTVYVIFVIDKTGEISDIKPVREVKDGPGLTQEAIRIVASMPNWIPGRNNGHAVACTFTLPIKFTLN